VDVEREEGVEVSVGTGVFVELFEWAAETEGTEDFVAVIVTVPVLVALVVLVTGRV
jgi:hypothetical protein